MNPIVLPISLALSIFLTISMLAFKLTSTPRTLLSSRNEKYQDDREAQLFNAQGSPAPTYPNARPGEVDVEQDWIPTWTRPRVQNDVKYNPCIGDGTEQGHANAEDNAGKAGVGTWVALKDVDWELSEMWLEEKRLRTEERERKMNVTRFATMSVAADVEATK